MTSRFKKRFKDFVKNETTNAITEVDSIDEDTWVEMQDMWEFGAELEDVAIWLLEQE